jgi:hypothetical protein
MDASCPHCGSARAEADVCFCAASATDTGADAARYATYRPNKWWLAAAIVGWLVTVPASLIPSSSSANLIGQACGMAFWAIAIRLFWVAVTARGPRFWERVLFSPWVWVIGMVVDVMTAAGRSHG